MGATTCKNTKIAIASFERTCTKLITELVMGWGSRGRCAVLCCAHTPFVPACAQPLPRSSSITRGARPSVSSEVLTQRGADSYRKPIRSHSFSCAAPSTSLQQPCVPYRQPEAQAGGRGASQHTHTAHMGGIASAPFSMYLYTCIMCIINVPTCAAAQTLAIKIQGQPSRSVPPKDASNNRQP